MEEILQRNHFTLSGNNLTIFGVSEVAEYVEKELAGTTVKEMLEKIFTNSDLLQECRESGICIIPDLALLAFTQGFITTEMFLASTEDDESIVMDIVLKNETFELKIQPTETVKSVRSERKRQDGNERPILTDADGNIYQF